MFLFAMKRRCLTLPPLLIKKKFCLSTLPPPPSPPQPRSWKIHAYLLSLPGWAWVISNRKRLANNMKAFIGLLLNWCVLFLLTGLGGLWDPEKSLVLRWLCSSLSCYMKKITRNFTTKIKLYHTILSSLYKAILTFLINFLGCLTRSGFWKTCGTRRFIVYLLAHTLAILLSVRAAVESMAVNSDLK